MAVIEMKEGDSYPHITAVLALGTTPIPLEGCTVKFIAVNENSGEEAVNAAAIVAEALAGTVRYEWIEGDTAIPGIYNVEWEITMPSGKKLTIPNDGYDKLVIKPELG